MKSKFPMYYNASTDLLENAKILRRNTTEAEEHLWKKIKGKKLGVKFRRQHLIDRFIADFYCHECKLVIEVDGGYHNEPNQMEYDFNRAFEIEQYDIQIIRFSNDEVLLKTDFVLQEISKRVESLKGRLL